MILKNGFFRVSAENPIVPRDSTAAVPPSDFEAVPPEPVPEDSSSLGVQPVTKSSPNTDIAIIHLEERVSIFDSPDPAAINPEDRTAKQLLIAAQFLIRYSLE